MAPHPKLLDTPNDSAQTPIHLAASIGQWRMVRWLIVAGAKPSPRNIRGDSPLHIAARNGDVFCCKAITDPVQEQERKALGLSYAQQSYYELNLDQWNYEGESGEGSSKPYLKRTLVVSECLSHNSGFPMMQKSCACKDGCLVGRKNVPCKMERTVTELEKLHRTGTRTRCVSDTRSILDC
jgi:ankyrin repeat protein